MRLAVALLWASLAVGAANEERLRDLRSDVPAVRANAAIALGRTGDREAVPALTKALSDTDRTVRRAAAKALGALKDGWATSSLMKALKDEDANVRFYAAYALGEIKDYKAMEALVEALRDPAWSVQEQAAWAIRETGARPVAQFLAAGVHHDCANVTHAVWILRHLAPEDAILPLLKIFEHKDASVRRHALEALIQLGVPETFDPLVSALGDADAGIRLRAVGALRSLGDDRAAGPLKELAAREESANVRAAAEAAATELTREPNIAAHWSFDDGTARDVTGFGNDGKVIGCKPVEGKAGKALRFGPRRYVELDKPAALPIANRPFTIMAWAKTDKPDGVVVARGGAFCGYSLYIKDGRAKFGIHRNQDGPGTIAAGKAKATGRWVHLAGVVRADRIDLFVDGKLAASAKAGPLSSDCGQGMEIGFDVGNSPAEIVTPFDGVIDEVKAYGIALTAERIKEEAEQN